MVSKALAWAGDGGEAAARDGEARAWAGDSGEAAARGRESRAWAADGGDLRMDFHRNFHRNRIFDSSFNERSCKVEFNAKKTAFRINRAGKCHGEMNLRECV